MKRAGIRTYLFISPIIPFISDIESIFSLAGDSIDFAMGEILNTKRNNIKKLRSILEKLVGYNKVSEILNLCKDNEYLSTIQDKFEALCRAYRVENKGFLLIRIKQYENIIVYKRRKDGKRLFILSGKV